MNNNLDVVTALLEMGANVEEPDSVSDSIGLLNLILLLCYLLGSVDNYNVP